ncbi:MAG: carboxymuconolactone decarboxylase family protein [Rhodocyclaceae bacterium]
MNKLAGTIMLSALAMTGAEAEETPARRYAPAAVYTLAPGLGRFTDEVLFGEVWARAPLAARDRSMLTVATLVATGKTEQLAAHVGLALDNGVAPGEIGEIVTHLAFYSGWPNAMSAVPEIRKVFDARGIGAQQDSAAARIALEAAAEAARKDAVDNNVGPTSPPLADLTNRVLFGALWQRPDLSARDRSMVTVAALIALGQAEQLPFHAHRAMDSGLSRAEMAEIPAHLAFYAGWPRAMSAVPVLQRVFAARPPVDAASTAPLSLTRAGTGNNPGPAAYFTGTVTVAGVYQAEAPARIGGGTVSFAAGARTAWHTHPLGQTLYIISGAGWVQREGGPIEAVGPGDVVWIPPHVRHWHGARTDSPMSHFAVAEALDGSVVTWMEHVSDADYTADL